MTEESDAMPKINNASIIDEISANEMIRAAELSMQMELDRYDSLLSSATRLLTCISILSVALIALITPLNGVAAEIGKPVSLTPFYLIEFFFLFASFACALLTQWRFKYQRLTSPASIAQQFQDEQDSPSRKDAAAHFCNSIQPCFDSFVTRNDKIRNYVEASSVALGLALMVLLISAIHVVALSA